MSSKKNKEISFLRCILLKSIFAKKKKISKEQHQQNFICSGAEAAKKLWVKNIQREAFKEIAFFVGHGNSKRASLSFVIYLTFIARKLFKAQLILAASYYYFIVCMSRIYFC